MKLTTKTLTLAFILTFSIATVSADAVPQVEEISIEPSEISEGDSVTATVIASSFGEYDLATAVFELNGERKESSCQNSYACSAQIDFTADSDTEQIKAKVYDSEGLSSDFKTKEYEIGNQKNEDPKAKISLENSNPEIGESIRISGTESSDADGEIVKYEWRFSGENSYSKTGRTIFKSFKNSGEKSVELKVTDDDGATDTAKKTIEVKDRSGNNYVDINLRKPSNSATQVSRTPTFEWITYHKGDLTDFTLKVEEKNYEADEPWNQGETYEVSSGDGETKSFNIGSTLKPDTKYIWGIEAKLDGERVESEVWSFRTKDREKEDNYPKADFSISDRSPKVGESVRFDASESSDEDGSIEEYLWDFDQDGSYERSGRTIFKSFGNSGSKSITLKVVDSDGLNDRKTKSINVGKRESDEENLEAFFTVSDSTPEIGESVRFDASGSDGDIKEYRWTFPEGSNRYGETIYRSFNSKGEKKVRLKVTDYDGDTDSFSRTLNVKRERNDDDDSDNGDDKDTDTEAFFTVSKTNPRVSESVRFDASDSTGDLKEYRWTFPQGATRYGETIYRSFSTAGSKTVRLKVTDYDGDSDTYSRTLNVQDQQKCGIHVGSLRLEDYEIEEGDTTEASIEVSNTGDTQDFNIKIFRGNRELIDRSTSISEGGERTFSTDVTTESDTTVRVEIRTSGSPCGSQFFERSRNLDVVDEDDDGKRPTARLDIDPNNADIGEEVEFDARESSDPDGDIEEYEFDIDGDGDYDITSDDGEVERTFFREIDDRAKVRVTDDDGYTDTDTERFRVRAKSRVSFSDINIPDDVCAGESFDVTFDARNIGDDERVLIVEGEGFGDRNSFSTHLEEDEEEEVTITFTTDQPGTEEFTISSVGGNSDTIENTIEVLDCETTGGEVEGISMKLVPDRVRAGEAVKVSGYVENARGRQDVRIEINGRRMTELSTEPDGYYSTYIYPERTGRVQISAESEEFRAVRDLNVLPTVSVGSMDIPETVFQGDEMEVCAEVNSQNIPAVLLVVDGEIVESKNERGEVCFDTTAKKQGDVTYEVIGLARGQRSTSEREVEVHEAKPEASSFPGQVASVESGRGIVKSTIYNNNDRRTEYYVSIRGLPDTWTSTTEKQVILQPGEQREVFFYLTPREEGTYDPLVTITSGTEIVHTEEVDVEVGGTSKPRNLSLFERLRNAFL